MSVGQVNETASNRVWPAPFAHSTLPDRTLAGGTIRFVAHVRQAVGAKAISFCLATLGPRHRGFVPRFVLGEGLVLHFGKDKVMTDL